MVSLTITAIAAFTLLNPLAHAHPGDDHREEVVRRAEWLNQVERRDLSHCAESLKARGIHARSHRTRSKIAHELRVKRGLSTAAPFLRARDLSTAAGTSHLSSLTGLSSDTSGDILFSSNSTCILNPETTEGPYSKPSFDVQGELVREDVTDGQAGVPMTTVIQIVNIDNCEPVTDMMLEIWHCNSTGVYSGVNANGNGNSEDTENIDRTFLRGIQASDENGNVRFDTLFPGHYQGRATHIHIMGHVGATVGDNATLSDQGRVDHVGQIFFDQDLITQVTALEPYSTNTQALTLNVDDSIAAQAAEDVDPFVEYGLLGTDLSSGILAWTTIAVNLTSERSVTAAVTLYEDGGVENPGARQGGPEGGPPTGANGTETTGVASASGSAATSVSGSRPLYEWYAPAAAMAAGVAALLI